MINKNGTDLPFEESFAVEEERYSGSTNQLEYTRRSEACINSETGIYIVQNTEYYDSGEEWKGIGGKREIIKTWK